MQSIAFANCQRGSIAVVASLVLAALFIGAGIAVDYGSMVSKRNTLQAVSDGAAIAVAREMMLANVGTSELETVANNMVLAKKDSSNSTWTVSVLVDDANSSVQVAVTESWSPFFAHLLSNAITPITTTATAQIVGTGKVCVVGLEQNQNRTVQLKKDAQLTANNCAVYSNSTSNDSMRIDSNGQMTAGLICSAGGASGDPAAYTPFATTDCPPLPDPLIDRTPPSVGSCDHTDFVATTPTTVSPGVYCGGLVADDAEVTFEPGIYIIKDGNLHASASGSFTGVNVGFYFTGTGGAIFGPNTSISLTAPKDGDMAGLLFFEDRDRASQAAFRITSNDARLLIGTIYLPLSILVVDANAPVADQSAYTAIVVRKLTLDAGPNLVLNTNYSATDIPVPGSLSGVGGRIVLAE